MKNNEREKWAEWKDPFRRTFKLSKSMEIALVCEANDLGCSEEELLDAICTAWLWHNNEHLKYLYQKAKDKKK